jgi:hypothetical protein
VHVIFLRIVAFLAGFAVVVATLYSALQTVVLPRAASDFLSRSVFRTMRRIFRVWADRARTYEEADAVLAYFAPTSLLMLPVVWLVCVSAGYTLMFWALGAASLRAAFVDSGSSLITLGFAPILTLPSTALAFSEGALGLILVALMIAYLPTMYAAFARREAAVNMLSVRAGDPPSAEEMILRYHRIHGLDGLREVWKNWESWFVDIDESHTSLAALSWFRSPMPGHSWVTAAGAVLDAASITNALLDIPHDAQADLCIRAGYLALRNIAGVFRVKYNQTPAPTDPISITRPEFDEMCERLVEAQVPVKPDRDQAWRDFAGWRVNYDTVLLSLALLTMAPYAPWSSDRAMMSLRPDGDGKRSKDKRI